MFSFNIAMDGFIDHDAVIADDELHDVASELLRTADMMLFGRVAYNLLADFWPSASSDKILPASTREFAEVISDMPKIVYSRTMQNVGWNTKIEEEWGPRWQRRLRD